jgi:hypothetical protein
MSPTLLSSATLPRRRSLRRLSLRRLAAWVMASATGRQTASAFVFTFAAIHALLWTVILINLKAAQDVHMDVAEAFAWGQKFQLGYGKHPPLAGWIAGLWFDMFPVTDWATYLLAMTTLAIGLVISWLIAIRVVDYRRAFFVVVMLAIYPIFNFKGFKFNPDLLQLVTLPLLVLAYLSAFEKRTALSGLWLGLAAALALMTKYWVLTMIGAVGLAALIHPDRLNFLRSPAPWVAIAAALVAMIPHLLWLKEVDFAPLVYAGDVYGNRTHAESTMLVLGYVEHNLGLLVLPVVIAGVAVAGTGLLRRPKVALARIWSRGAGAQRLDHPDRGRGRAAARRIDLVGLHEDRLGDLAVLSDAAGAGRRSTPALARRRPVPDRGNLAGADARHARRLAQHRAARDYRQSQCGLQLRCTLATGPRTDGPVAQPFLFTLVRGRRDDRDRRAHDVL